MRYCLALDLKPDPELIAEYEKWHTPEKIHQQVIEGIKAVGILEMEIYRWEYRLFMIVEVPDTFNWEAQMALLAELPGQKAWEQLMDAYQLRLKPGPDKWLKMDLIFKLSNC